MKSSVLNDVGTNLTRYLQLQRNMDLHDKRIQKAQPTMRVSREPTNRSAGHIKKQPLAQFNRIMTIDIENKALLKKLTDKSPSRIGKQQPYKLIKNNRRKNLEQFKQKIQNEGLLKRIKQVKSSYQQTRFSTQRKITERYINTISKFGYRNYQPNKTIMLPFYQRNNKKKANKVDEYSFENREVKVMSSEFKQQEKEDNAEKDIILSIDKKNWSCDNKTAKITYIVWQNKVSIQIDVQNDDSMCLQISKSIYSEHFNQNVRKLNNSIKFDDETQTFYIDLPNNNDINKQNK